MHSSRDIPHPMALALPIIHTGENPPYDFVLRHPTPHAQRHDLYIMQPQCSRLAVNNTFVFAVRQHPSSPQSAPKDDMPINGRASPSVFNRPSSALSMVSSTAGGSTISSNSNEFSASTSAISSTRSVGGREKPAKLAIQTPSGKIMRLTRKADHMMPVRPLQRYCHRCYRGRERMGDSDQDWRARSLAGIGPSRPLGSVVCILRMGMCLAIFAPFFFLFWS
ncbi:hypothetical protein N7470_006013 [Penicillium chermesinum]|nr:hypothetical protein N7470_006013 [Penicillium chermesinum]